MTPAAMRLKANLRNSSARTGIPAQLLLQDFFLERFLARFCASDVRAQFVFKGGILLMGLLGVARRTTMDLDATLRNAPLSGETVREMVSRVCAIDAGDGVSLSVSGVAPIRKDDEYGGFRVKVAARFETISGLLSIDVSTGDAIAGGPVEHDLPSQFDPGRTFRVYGYPVETILAEKIEAILSLGELGTRPRDYYDVHAILGRLPFSPERFAEAFRATVAHRGSAGRIGDPTARLADFAASDSLRGEWEKYRRRFRYAADITFDQTLDALRTVLAMIR